MMRKPILLLCGIALITMPACSNEAPPAAPPPPDVLVTVPIQRDVPVYMELVGQAVGFQDRKSFLGSFCGFGPDRTVTPLILIGSLE